MRPPQEWTCPGYGMIGACSPCPHAVSADGCPTCGCGCSRRRDKARPTIGTVYYLLVGDRIKVGWTANLRQRMRSYPPGHSLLATESGTRADEAAVHQRCTPWRISGREWYDDNGPMRRVAAEAEQRQHEQYLRDHPQGLRNAPPARRGSVHLPRGQAGRPTP